MKVHNKKLLFHLAWRSMSKTSKRQLIAILAIALTATLFTSLLTILSFVNSSYQSYLFRMAGSVCHGTFKQLQQEQVTALSAHPKVQDFGIRIVLADIRDRGFSRKAAEISFMDANCAKWSYALPRTGRLPEREHEVSMDIGALEALGIRPELNAKVSLNLTLVQDGGKVFSQTADFILVGYGPEDDLLPVHHINVSAAFAEKINKQAQLSGLSPLPIDLNVMLRSPFKLRQQMEQIDRDLGYSWEQAQAENAACIGVNWGYSSEVLWQNLDGGMVLALIAILLIIGLTAYLIIYNVFYISINQDVRYYGLLKTLGVTSRQIKTIIRWQALILGLFGTSPGLLLGYALGSLLAPQVAQNFNPHWRNQPLSPSPIIFVLAVLFVLLTLIISCRQPGRLAAKISAIEASKYSSIASLKVFKRPSPSGKMWQLALVNLSRFPKRTVIVISSLAFSVILLNVLYVASCGFDMDKYLSRKSCADFLLGTSNYFNRQVLTGNDLSDALITDLKTKMQTINDGSAYTLSPPVHAEVLLRPEQTSAHPSTSGVSKDTRPSRNPVGQQTDSLSRMALVEGLDPNLFSQLTVLAGKLSELNQPGSRQIALVVQTDDYGHAIDLNNYPLLGQKLRLSYVHQASIRDSRNGSYADETTPNDHLLYQIEKAKEVDYTVAAYVTCPSTMGFRYSIDGYHLILPTEDLKQDSEAEICPMFYLFDVQDQATEAKAENYLKALSEQNSRLRYESKRSLRRELENFQKMFILVGSSLCLLIAVIGALNFLNTVVSGILSRKYEFAILQAVGMSKQQLRRMLRWESLAYTLGSIVLALVLSFPLSHLAAFALARILWFFSPHVTLLPLLWALPLYALLGFFTPGLIYGQTIRKSLVENLRDLN